MRRRAEAGFGEIWVVVADVMLAFLLLVLLTIPRPKAPEKKGTYERPIALGEFLHDLEVLQRSGVCDLEPQFAEVNVSFNSDLLFKKCDWQLTDKGKKRIDDFAQLLWKRTSVLQRVEIEGYADRVSAADCSSLAQFKESELSADNWNLLLSSLRAMSVQQKLIDNAANGVTQDTIDHRVRLLEAVGGGDLHPKDSEDPDNQRNRRVDIRVHFVETTSASKRINP
jgi:outer membrane protein OmpA-like peptidoglycan-associated protein